jgi:hypothetical protein
MFVLSRRATEAVRVAVLNNYQLIVGSTCRMILGSRLAIQGMYALEIEVSIMIIDIYLLTCTYKVSSFNGRACSS